MRIFIDGMEMTKFLYGENDSLYPYDALRRPYSVEPVFPMSEDKSFPDSFGNEFKSLNEKIKREEREKQQLMAREMIKESIQKSMEEGLGAFDELVSSIPRYNKMPDYEKSNAVLSEIERRNMVKRK